MQLDPTAMAAGVRLITHDTLGSTNAEALRMARDGECGPLWIVARSQTAGRGRRGRTWVSEPGNLYASLILTDPAPPERFPDLSFVAALALHADDAHRSGQGHCQAGERDQEQPKGQMPAHPRLARQHGSRPPRSGRRRRPRA